MDRQRARRLQILLMGRLFAGERQVCDQRIFTGALPCALAGAASRFA
jgi:hypothetical protein